jgi:hypothetical protein
MPAVAVRLGDSTSRFGQWHTSSPSKASSKLLLASGKLKIRMCKRQVHPDSVVGLRDGRGATIASHASDLAHDAYPDAMYRMLGPHSYEW